MQTNVTNGDTCVFSIITVSIQVITIAIPYEAFNLTKKSDFVKYAMDRFVSINKIRLENFIQVW